MKRKKTGFTLVELLTVLAIIMLLIGLLVPSLATVRRLARDTKQRAQLTTIGLGLTAFRNDDGEYPPSDRESHNTHVFDYCGAQKLAEALLGWDLLGFHPDSAWAANGYDATGREFTYDPERIRGDVTLHERRGPYLELGTSNAFRLGDSGQGDGLFANASAVLDPDPFVLCDVFYAKEITFLPGGQKARAGTPILYYRANTSSRIFAADNPASIYYFDDNARLLSLGMVANPRPVGPHHPLYDAGAFQSYLEDPRASNPAAGLSWPYRPDSYILISAGADGRYGTSDDITNFAN